MELYAAYLGGPLADGRVGDALERIVRVDGYDVTLTASADGATGTGDHLEMETFN